MNITTANVHQKKSVNYQPIGNNTDLLTDTSNLNHLKTKISKVMLTNKPIIYLNVKLLNENCLEVLKFAKANNVSVMFVNRNKAEEIENSKFIEPVKNSIKLRLEDGTRYLKYKDIIRLESVSNYTFIHTTLFVKPFISSKTLKFYNQNLNDMQFIRIHRSHLVNKAHIKTYIGGSEKCLLLTNHEQVVISRRKLSEVLEKIDYTF